MPRARSYVPGLSAAGDMPLATLPRVGPVLARKFAARGILTLQDLWLLLPLRYEDRTRLTPIAQLQDGVAAQIEGWVEAAERGFRYRPLLRVLLSDSSHSTLAMRFFHFRAAQVARLAVGTRVRAYGVPKLGQHGWDIVHPSYRILAPGEDVPLNDCLDPVYPVIEGVGPGIVRQLIREALEHLPADAALELLPDVWLRDLGLPSLRTALLIMHRPPLDADIARLLVGTHPAQQRLSLEELLAHQLSLRRQRITLQRHAAPVLPNRSSLVAGLLHTLPFSLTGAQQRVFAEIAADLAKPVPMLRLVQGDVGSGKTVVAALAALLAVEQGKQVVLAAPTALLAEQHFTNLCDWLEPLGVRVRWLAGKVTGKARIQALTEVASGDAQVVVGTHALMQECVVFHDLALTIVDEQHRFGVHQRLTLRDKGAAAGMVPHQLVMTATPIPRTLAMAAYADLDVSVIDEVPPGRTPVQTNVLNAERRPELVERIRLACAQGRQVYWVCTLIDESQTEAGHVTGRGNDLGNRSEVQAAQATYEALSEQLPGVRVGLVHGRMKADEKQRTMRAFKCNEIDLLVATTVIEVGVDVPNASLMIIENAERLGLAQLHQLRGRVGRGAAVSSCVLLYQVPLSMLARQRLEIMRQTNDGFVIAERDLELRGPGELLGTRQTGLATFRVADLARDVDLLPRVCVLANMLLAESPQLADQVIERWIGSSVRYAAA
ncbi:ATP-dependent DNA helicase RecG [Xylella taiwanensis]|uniref:ATP-dependent DNA helicase RecG n=1 Tax=Xylella taiwanensis TaxID=1444770 RepID=Z9JM04_9GAMM|nr:ATP-dependent DNA helicase RecG [Xylella taiwanensis]AXI84189.1 ATP-dependent DNA helicase RecG [Xylella taiwanensis]EWS78861.1 ATP-dependent DNA helicase RecG [Xylella taiwanensis]MCD8459718.1 ATP-dependent DNA helicase RecG [Xylella taiwanensis]MCD8461412.1 ATP-dependent DNA helicase RecG [Xylella taiwanensis]MCD8466343.1 ATP-dependent DNA helicase RecG [Xylella taiwanensis]